MTSLTPVGLSSCSRTTYGFTSKDCIEALYGSRGYDNVLSDTGSAEDAVVDSIIVDAEQTVIIRIGKFFSPEDMATSQFVNSRTTWIAAHLLSKRRGNPHYFEDLYMEAIRELEAISTGELSPPNEIPLRSYITPSMSNLIVDERFGVSKLRVRDFISVGGTYPDQHIAYAYYWGWL